MTQGIYVIANAVNGDRYIGSSIDCERRFRQHARALNGARHVNQHLANAWSKYGASSFYILIIEIVDDRASLAAHEQVWLQFGQYNLAPKADRPPGIGRLMTDAERARLSAARLGKPCPWLLGIRPDKAIAASILATKGKLRSPEVRAAISAATKGSSSAKRSAALIGNRRGAVPCSAQKRQKLVEALNQPQVRAKLSAAKKAMHRSPEHCRRIAETQRARWAIRLAAGLGRSNP